MYDSVDLGGVNPMGARARKRWRARLRNPVRKVSSGMGGARLATGFFDSGAAPSGGGGSWSGGGGGGYHHKRHGGFYPYYPIYYPYYYPSAYYYPYAYPYTWSYPYYYGARQPAYRETVPSSCCYNTETGTLYCPGSQYDGAPAYAEATRMYKGRPMSFVTSPQLGQAQWFWDCPTQAEPSAIPNRGRAPRRALLRAA